MYNFKINHKDIINEIQILYRLNHPNIVKIKEIYERNN